MARSGPTLHPPVLRDPSDVAFVSTSLAGLVDERRLHATAEIELVEGADIHIPIDSVSKNGSFDAYIHVGLVGGGHPNIKLMVDSGNSTLVLPHFDAISQLPNFDKNYKVAPDVVTEPWCGQARMVTGPIVLQRTGGTYTIPNCQFYACIGPNQDGCYTANFGIGRVDPWSAADKHGLQSPLSYDSDYNYLQIDYAPIDQVLRSGNKPHVAPGSSLTLSKARPAGYPTMFQIVPGKPWMSLRPQSLDIGRLRTKWPGDNEAAPIAMIDTGGGPVFLSDPENYLRKTDWPGAVPEPIPTYWISSCTGISDDLAFTLSDGNQSVSLAIATKSLSPAVQGLTLVICDDCHFMFGEDGMTSED
jgi:hypothetical protein